MASIEINGVDELIKKLGKATANKTLRPPMGGALGRIKRDMSRYPRQPPSKRPYNRTDTLKNAWHTPSVESIKNVAGGTVGRVGTNLKYAPFVQSHQFQARRMGYWRTDQEVLEKNSKAIVRDFERAIEKALR